MNYKLLENVFFPFQAKGLTRFFGISVVLISLFVTSFAVDDVRQFDEKSAKQLIKQAEKLTRKGNLLEAEQILLSVIKQDTGNTKAKLFLSYVLLKQRRLVESYRIAFDIAKDDPQNARAFGIVGMNLLNLGNFKEARLIFKNSNNLNRNEPLAWFGFGLLDFYENRIQDGIEKLKNAEYLEPNEPDFVFALAQVYSRAERYSDAADSYNKFLGISPPSDSERRNRIKGLISFLRYLGHKQELYQLEGGPQQSAISFQMLRDRPILEVKVNGKDEKLRFVLDTGSGITVISTKTAERLKIKPVSKGGLARAVGGDGKFEIVYGFLKKVSVGAMNIKSVPVYIRKFHDDTERIDGYIGLSLISKFLTTVDYGNSTFTLTRKNKETIRNFEKEEIALPLRLTSSGFLSGEVQLPGIESPLNFIVDTGASISVISQDLAETDELRGFSTKERMRVVGAAGVTENVQSFLIPKVSFGAHSRESIKAIALDLDVINEASGFRQAGILGGNFLKNYRLTFDFENSKVTFRPVN